MKRRYSMLLVCIAAVVAGLAIWLRSPALPHPHSEVPLTADLGWWPYQEGLTLKELTAEAPSPKLGLFNSRFLMRYHLAGSVTYRKGWRPKIARVQSTCRLVCRGPSPNPSTAEVLLVPVVEVSPDEHYSGEPIAFSLKLEQILNTMNWGKNVYEIHCLGRTAAVSVQQYK